MRTIIWVLAWIGVGLWSLVAWLGHGLVGVAGSIAGGNADIVPVNPESVVWLSEFLGFLTGFGQGAVVVIWAIVSLIILGVAALLARFVGGRRAALPRR